LFPAALTAYRATAQVVVVPTPSPAEILFSPSPSPSPVTPGDFTVLLLGSDDDSKFDKDHVLTQSMILVRVMPAKKQVVMISIPRDLYVPLSVGWSGKIDGAYSYGGAGAAIATVERNFGVKVNDYIWVGLLGLIHVIDAIGGIDVVTTNPVLDDYYPQDVDGGNPYGYKRVAVLAGPQHLDGRHAMEYVRSRHSDYQSDFGRSKRQQQVLTAIRQKAKVLGPADVPVLASAIGGEVKTSIGLDRIAMLLPLAASFDNPDSIQQFILNSPYTRGGAPDGSLYPNWGLILPLVRQYFP
jgi:LCP family protein required for cell wall assembly